MEKQDSNPILVMIKTEWDSLGSNKPIFIFYMSLFVIAGLIQLITPWLIGTIFNSIQNGEIATEQELTKLFLMIFLIFIIQVVFWIFHGSARIMEILTAFHTHRNYTNIKIEKTVELPVKWHKDNHSGNTIDRINKARNALFGYSRHESFNLIAIAINIFGSLAVIFFVNPKIGVFALIFSSVILFGTMRLDKKVKKHYRNVNKFEHKLSASIFDYFSNIMTVITLRLKGTVKKKIDERIKASHTDHKKSAYLIITKWGLGSLAITLMTVIALIYQSYTDFHTNGTILIGTLFILYSYLERVGMAFFQFAQFYGNMTQRATDIESSEPIDNAFKKIETKLETKLPKKWEQIDIKGLDFTYNQEGNIRHIDNIDFTFKRGQKIALIGESGSGKSTILALLRGLYQPQKAKVFCDGKRLRNKINTIKQSVTLIPQDPEIFNDTIRYNITMDMFSNSQDLKKAIQMAQFETVVNRLEKGIDTNVQERGVSLSGGEKQRLALARGLLAAKDSDIILLDEPTSSVDSNNERKIHGNIFKEFKDKTIISSIHRLHLLPKFDYIYMFDKGKIVGQGTFKEIKNDPIFKKIWESYIGNIKK